MVLDLLNTAILSGLETFVNQMLALDPATREKLKRLSGKVVRVHCDLPEVAINLLISDDRILMSLGGMGEEMKADAVVSGNAPALLRLLIKKEHANLHDDGILVTGNAGLLNALQEVLLNLNVDWEYQLSRFIGDIPTQAVSDTLSMAGDVARRAGDSLNQDIDDWLHEEKKLFPTGPQLTRFYQAVDDLRLRVDRLSSRTDRLLASRAR